jgi:hypothetical protein
MSVLDEITKLKQQGYSEQQIIQNLKEKNISPKEISQALDQANIKTAVDQEQDMQQSIMNKTQEVDEGPYSQYQGYGGDYNQNQQSQYSQDQSQYPQTQEQYPQDEGQYSQEGYQDYNPAAYPNQYSQYQEYPSENMSEIAEGVVAEKTQELKKHLSSLIQNQKFLDNQLAGIDERLKRIEKIIDKLEIQIIGKIADYGKDIQDINKEMKTMQNSFSKIINPLVDKKKQTKTKKDEFEKYLR